MREQAELLGASWRTVSLELARGVDGGLVGHRSGRPRRRSFRRHRAADARGVPARPGHIISTFRANCRSSGRRSDATAEAVSAGVMLMPGAAWSVAATDCLAAHVARAPAGGEIPAARHDPVPALFARHRPQRVRAHVVRSRHPPERQTDVRSDRPNGAGFRLWRGRAKKHGAELARRVVRLSHDRHSQHRSLHGGRRSRLVSSRR